MRLAEILTEYGRRGFRGTGNGFFQQRQYIYLANALHDLTDVHEKEFLTKWFIRILQADNNRFKESRFLSAVQNGMTERSDPNFQQRHFYYLAHFIKNEPDPATREHLTKWIGDIVGRTNSNFKPSRWKEFCTPKDDE